MKRQHPRPNPEAHPVRDAPLRRIDAMRQRIVAEIARDFRKERQAEALGLVAQALLMEVRHRSSTDYALGWLEVMHALFQGTLDEAAQTMVRVAELEPKLH
jgi:hypothetical protein